ncbi:MAG: RDD family protein [Defluviitaleaceae bacterium]|nr:RDD family protein [Defluviitaleaceae bacterium]
MEKHDKLGNIAMLTDIAFASYKKTFALQAGMMGLIGSVFIIVTLAFAQVSLAVILPAIPNFTGNQTITEGIILGIIVIVILFVIAFFLMWQAAIGAVICRHDKGKDTDVLDIIKAAGKAAVSVLTVLFAFILLFVPFLVIFTFIAAVNLSAIFNLALPILIVLSLIFITIRTFSFFAMNLTLDGSHRFLSAIIQSAKMVMRLGFLRIFVITASTIIVNFGVFTLLFSGILAVFGQFPTDILGLVDLVTNPIGTGALMFFAYLATLLITPKTQILAHTMYSWQSLRSKQDAPDIASRSLSAAMDIVIVGVFFAAIFSGAARMVSGGDFAVTDMNVFAMVIVLIAFFIVFTIYNIYFEVFGGGQTPAKRFFGLIVRGRDDSHISLAQSFVRNMLRVVDIVGSLAIMFNKQHRRVGDMLSLAMVKYQGSDEKIVVDEKPLTTKTTKTTKKPHKHKVPKEDSDEKIIPDKKPLTTKTTKNTKKQKQPKKRKRTT